MEKLARNRFISWSEAYSLPSTYTRVIYGNQLRQSLFSGQYSEQTFNSVIFVLLKVHLCRYETLTVSLSSHKNNIPKVSHQNTDYFLRYTKVYL